MRDALLPHISIPPRLPSASPPPTPWHPLVLPLPHGSALSEGGRGGTTRGRAPRLPPLGRVHCGPARSSCGSVAHVSLAPGDVPPSGWATARVPVTCRRALGFFPFGAIVSPHPVQEFRVGGSQVGRWRRVRAREPRPPGPALAAPCRPQLPGLGRSDGRVPGASVSIRNVPMTSSIFLFAIRRVWGGVCPEQSPPFRLDCWLSRCRVFRGRVHFGDRPCIGRVACPRSAARPLVLLSSVDSGSCSCLRSPIDPSFFYFADHAFGTLFNSSLPN